MMTNQELESLLNTGESDRIERKSSISDNRKIRRTVCAFANDLPNNGTPGVIFVGINDDGSCSELDINDELLTNISNFCRDGNILPTPTAVVDRHILNGCEVAAVIVEPSKNPPVRYNGRVYVRVGPSTRQATPEEESRLAERRQSADMPFDHQAVPDVSIQDLDLEFFQKEYLTSAVRPDILMENRRNVEDQLISLRLLTPDGKPTFGALLIFGKDPLRWIPGAYIQFVRFDGTEITDPIRDEKVLSGPLSQILRYLDEVLGINISTSVNAAGPHREVRHPDYPIVALQQLTRNAVIHRKYDTTNAPTRISWFHDRIEIDNPGGLYGLAGCGNSGVCLAL